MPTAILLKFDDFEPIPSRLGWNSASDSETEGTYFRGRGYSGDDASGWFVK